MKLNKKTTVISLSALVIAISAGSILSSKMILPKVVDAKDVNYTLTLDKDCDKTIDVMGYLEEFNTSTTNGNEINFYGCWALNSDNKLCALDNAGLISNETAINGLKSISIKLGTISEGIESSMKTNTLDIIWGWEAIDGVAFGLEDFKERLVTEDNTTLTFNFNNDRPSYFCIASETDYVEIETITLSYSCYEYEAPSIYGFEFTKIESEDKYIVTNCILRNTPNIVIPNEYNGMPVVGIDDFVFTEIYNIETVTLPDTLTYIGRAAFYGCSKLESINIPENLEFIGDYTYNKISNSFACCPKLKNISVDENNPYFEFIDGCLVQNSKNSTEKTLLIAATNGCKVPSCVEEIAEQAFFGITDEDIVINDGCEIIYNHVFGEIQNVKRIFLPSSLNIIGSSAVDSTINENLKFYTDATGAEVLEKSWNCSTIKDNLLYSYNNKFEFVAKGVVR